HDRGPAACSPPRVRIKIANRPPVILHPTRVQGAFLIELATFADERGSFTEVYQLRALAERGWHGSFVRSALSHNHARGTLRGMHFQRAPHAEAKLVICVQGAV